jgi:hypothetical protein
MSHENLATYFQDNLFSGQTYFQDLTKISRIWRHCAAALLNHVANLVAVSADNFLLLGMNH